MLSGMAVADVAKPHDEVRGQGSALLMIPGVGGDAGYYAQASEELADAFTVITYGRRGNSRSTGGTDGPMTVAQQADDAKVLVGELADGQALVFGSSGGAIIGLELAARYPPSTHRAHRARTTDGRCPTRR